MELRGESNFSIQPLDGRRPQFVAQTEIELINYHQWEHFLKKYVQNKMLPSYVIKRVLVKVTGSFGKKMVSLNKNLTCTYSEPLPPNDQENEWDPRGFIEKRK